MGRKNAKLQEIIDFFELEEGYDKSEIMADVLSQIKELKGYAADEIGLEWDGETLMVLSDFTEQFYSKMIEIVCNVLKSFQGVVTNSDTERSVKNGKV